MQLLLLRADGHDSRELGLLFLAAIDALVRRSPRHDCRVGHAPFRLTILLLIGRLFHARLQKGPVRALEMQLR